MDKGAEMLGEREMDGKKEGGGGKGGGGRWRGLLPGLRNVSLHFSHLENSERAKERWRERRRWCKVGIKLMDALL